MDDFSKWRDYYSIIVHIESGQWQALSNGRSQHVSCILTGRFFGNCQNSQKSWGNWACGNSVYQALFLSAVKRLGRCKAKSLARWRSHTSWYGTPTSNQSHLQSTTYTKKYISSSYCKRKLYRYRISLIGHHGYLLLVFVWLLFEGGYYSRAAFSSLGSLQTSTMAW